MKIFFTAIATGVLTYFAPVQMILLLVGLAIGWRAGFDFWEVNKSKRSRGTKCKALKILGRETIIRMVLYHLAILTFFPIDKELLVFFGSENFIITKAIAVLLIAFEAYMANMKLKLITGKGVVDRLKGFTEKVGEIKNIKDDLLK